MATPTAPASETPRSRLVSIAALIVLALALGAGLLYLSGALHKQIARNEQAWVLEQLNVLVPATSYDNDVIADRIVVSAPQFLGTAQPMIVHRARHEHQPVAAILRPTAPDGYGGPIELMVAVDPGGKVLGVQVLRHHETPGIGDQFEPRRSSWLQNFRGKSLGSPPPARWTIRKDGGDFDQFTGATLTPRAIARAVRRTLEYYAANRDAIFAMPAVDD
jgi:electron transport complex protein RnfG